MNQISLPKPPFLSFLPEAEKPIDPDCFQVFVRVRPLNSRELSLINSKKKPSIIKKQENMVYNLINPLKNFNF